MSKAALPWEAVLEHLGTHNAALCRGILGPVVMTTGSGPWKEEKFDVFLRRCGIEPVSPEETGPAVLVVGHDDWDSDDLCAAVEVRVGRVLKVYSQEMVLVSLAAGQDAFDLFSDEELAAFGEGHSAPEYLMQDAGFDWPTTDVVLNSNRLVIDFADGKWPETGVLKKMGYKVGQRGRSSSARLQVLDQVMEVRLVPGSDGAEAYIQQWGEPMTTVRLLKIANCLASFAVGKKRVTPRDCSEAIAHWESDLEYLRAVYYEERNSTFRWPDTNVQKR